MLTRGGLLEFGSVGYGVSFPLPLWVNRPNRYRSGEDTPLNVEDLPHNDPSAEDEEASQSTEAADAEVKIYEEYLASGEDLGQESDSVCGAVSKTATFAGAEARSAVQKST